MFLVIQQNSADILIHDACAANLVTVSKLINAISHTSYGLAALVSEEENEEGGGFA